MKQQRKHISQQAFTNVFQYTPLRRIRVRGNLPEELPPGWPRETPKTYEKSLKIDAPGRPPALPISPQPTPSHPPAIPHQFPKFPNDIMSPISPIHQNLTICPNKKAASPTVGLLGQLEQKIGAPEASADTIADIISQMSSSNTKLSR